MTEQPVETGPDHRPDLDAAPRAETTATLAEFVAVACLRGWCHESRVCAICEAWRQAGEQRDEARAQVERLRGQLAAVLTALNAGPEEDPVGAASFVQDAADAFARKTAELDAALAHAQAEVDRLRADRDVMGRKVAAIHAMLPRLAPHLPRDLFGELAAHVYVLPVRPMTDADVRRGQEIAKQLGALDEAGAGSVSRGEDATPARGVAAMLAEFHEAFEQPFGHGSVDASELRVSLHKEEQRELLAAYEARDLAAIAHELADVVYVAYGSAHSLGIPLDAVIAEVHRANMSKFGEDGRPVLRGDGKVMKGPNYRPPDVAAVLAGAPQSWVGEFVTALAGRTGARSVTPPPGPCANQHHEPLRADGTAVRSWDGETVATACCTGMAEDLADSVNRLDDVVGELNDVTHWLARLGVSARRPDGRWDIPAALRELAGPVTPPPDTLRAFLADTEKRLPRAALDAPDPLSDWGQGAKWMLDRAEAFVAAETRGALAAEHGAGEDPADGPDRSSLLHMLERISAAADIDPGGPQWLGDVVHLIGEGRRWREIRQRWPKLAGDLAAALVGQAPDGDPPARTDEEIARAFHDAYERLAPQHGYETRKASAKPWAEVPEQNRALMIATVGEVRGLLAGAFPAGPPYRTPAEGARVRAVLDALPDTKGEAR